MPVCTVRTRIFLTALIVAVSCWTALCEENPATDATKAGEVREDFLVPTSPAFVALGISPNEVTRPDTPKAFALALLNGIDSGGKLQSGVAIDVAPYYLFQGRELILREYRASEAVQIASRFQLSLATSKGINGDDESAHLGVGFRLSLLDGGDPRMSSLLDDCYGEIRSGGEYEEARLEAARLEGQLLRVEEMELKEAAAKLEALRAENDDAGAAQLEKEIEELSRKQEELQKRRDAARAKVEALRPKEAEFLTAAWKVMQQAVRGGFLERDQSELRGCADFL